MCALVSIKFSWNMEKPGYSYQVSDNPSSRLLSDFSTSEKIVTSLWNDHLPQSKCHVSTVGQAKHQL